ETATIWTKPDDLVVDLKDPFKGLVRPGRAFIRVVMADGSVRQFRTSVDKTTLAAMFTWRAGENVEITPEQEVPVSPRNNALPFDWLPSENDWKRLESLGLDLNKLRRFLRVGVGDQIGFHMHDGQKMLDFDIGSALSGHGDALGTRFGGAAMFGIGL